MPEFSGSGATLVMAPSLNLLMPSSQAILLALSVDVLGMIPIIRRAAQQAEWKPILPLVIGAFIAITSGAWISVMASPETMQIIISILLLTVACLLLRGWTY